MAELHPITPPSELIEEWIELSRPRKDHSPNPNVLATYAARWGSDRELQLCLEWFQEFYKGETWVDKDLRAFMAARRPKAPNLTNPTIPPPELVRKWQREANHNKPMFPQVAAMAAQWGYEQHEKMLLDAMHAIVPLPVAEDDIDLFQDQ